MSLPYFPMFPSDFEAKTSHLTLAEDGAYNRLLRICWMTPGCTIPTDETWIMRRVRAFTDADREAVITVLEEFFTVENGRYSNAKLMRIWCEANEAHEKRKNAGAKGGKAKARKTNNISPSNAVAKPKQPEPEPEPEPEVDTDVSTKRVLDRSAGFDAFWEIWPNKTAKQNAKKAWARLPIEQRRAAYSAVLNGWFDQWQQSKPGASPIHPATFLNGRRWEDQTPPRQFNGGNTNGKRSIAERLAARFPDLDSWSDRDASQPLLPPDDERGSRGCGDSGLDQGVVRLFSGTDKRGL